ncbi:hypothetical protein B296_00023649 [Ensete ventricosum]|uniref:RING-type E3 ubiquitin transferase n=1 Tax=Ensete ventricosum TaxID=4639 RepID=A0A426XSW2_ENSVE|nr:hypothetical protein B296_00023649 [Ensete ventricosum]
MDQQMFWNNFLHNSVENQDLPNNSLSPGDANISCGNVPGQESASLNVWDPVGPSSSMLPLNQGNHDEVKLESSWTPSPLVNRVGGPRITDVRSQSVNTVSFENQNTGLNSGHVNNGEELSQFLNFHGPPDNSGYSSEHVGLSNQVLESGLHPGLYNPGLMHREHVPFIGSSSGSSRAIDFLSNNERGRQEIAQCSSHKRKNIEGTHGECSASGSSSNFSEGETNYCLLFLLFNLLLLLRKSGTFTTEVGSSSGSPALAVDGAAGELNSPSLRNVFDRIRRGDNLMLETPLYLQELLALGERIGNVNTGLSEEKILNCLRQRKYVSNASEASEEAEPCCICRVSHSESLGFVFSGWTKELFASDYRKNTSKGRSWADLIVATTSTQPA